MSAAIRQDRACLSGKVIAAKHVHVVSAQPAAHLAQGAATEPRITLLKDGDRVRAIEIVCTCGEVIRFDCVY